MYPGGKGKSFQQIINLMPRHDTYIEPFLGSAAVLKNKLAAKVNIVNDLEESCLQDISLVNCKLEKYNKDAVELLKNTLLDERTLIYCDPPYVQSTRKKQKIYKHEYSDDMHIELLEFLTKQTCMVMISGYDSSLYQKYLRNWNSYSFSSQTQNGVREETVWFNFEKPHNLHDPTHLGNCFRERQTIKRRVNRLKHKFIQMDTQERSAFMEWLNHEFTI